MPRPSPSGPLRSPNPIQLFAGYLVGPTAETDDEFELLSAELPREGAGPFLRHRPPDPLGALVGLRRHLQLDAEAVLAVGNSPGASHALQSVHHAGHGPG